MSLLNQTLFWALKIFMGFGYQATGCLDRTAVRYSPSPVLAMAILKDTSKRACVLTARSVVRNGLVVMRAVLRIGYHKRRAWVHLSMSLSVCPSMIRV